jgi:hypothetical protein
VYYPVLKQPIRGSYIPTNVLKKAFIALYFAKDVPRSYDAINVVGQGNCVGQKGVYAADCELDIFLVEMNAAKVVFGFLDII